MRPVGRGDPGERGLCENQGRLERNGIWHNGRQRHRAAEYPVKTRVAIPEELKNEILSRSNNRCCVCQMPFVQFHHIDEDPSNNDFDNIAPVCPNCHNQAHTHAALTVNLTPPRLKAIRDRWYAYCESRKDASGISAVGLLRLKNLGLSAGIREKVQISMIQ
jgi:hypothetical protein